MSTLAAQGIEATIETDRPRLHVVREPEAVLLSDLPEDELLKKRAERFMRDIGSIALAGEVTSPPEAEGLNDSLLTAIKRGAKGDKEADNMVSANIGSDYSERVLKTGEVTKFHLDVDEGGNLIQHGQRYTDIYTNTLELTSKNSNMRPRAEAETINAHRIEFWRAQGLLEDNYVVTWSLCADDMTDEELDEAGFFSATKTLSLQATTSEDSSVSVESAFIAGVKSKGEERIDIDTVVCLADSLGIDYSDMTVSEIIASPMLIPKSMMQDGVINLVELYDDFAGGTFFGQDKPRRDYREYRAHCDERRKTFARDISVVKELLYQEAEQLKTKQQAIGRLNKLCGAQMAKRATRDVTINTEVFGPEAAAHIAYARQQIELGNYQEALEAENRAVKTERSASCPSGMGRQSDFDVQGGDNNPKNEAMEDCEFISKKCPKCGEKNAKTKVSKGKFYHVGEACVA